MESLRKHSALWLALLPALGWSDARDGAELAPFRRVQPDLFASPEALTNAWADYDNDSDLDLIVTFKSGEVRLYRNDAGVFTNVGAELGLPVKGDEVRGASWGDYDGDGYLDLYLGTRGHPIPGRNLLYRNDAAKGFIEVAAKLGVDMPGVSSRQASWIDYDNDGDLDLFVANRTGDNAMFRNDGARFTDVSALTGLADPRRSVGACWFDMDGDGDLDMFLANQEGDRDAMYRNDGGRFVDVATSLAMDQPQRTLAEGGVGCSVGDYDNDGDLDLFVATYGVSLLYRNDGRGRFVEIGKTAGVDSRGHAVAASWGDFDNDGWLDLYVVDYAKAATGFQPRDHLFHNDGRRFTDLLTPEHVLNGADHGVQWADFDSDGDLDLALTDSRRRGAHWLLRNDLVEAQRRRALTVQVLDRHGLQTRAGDEVRLYDTAGRLIGTRLVPTGDGYGSQSAVPVHFGLAQLTNVTVEVTFMSAGGRKIQRLSGIDPAKYAGKSLVIRQE